MQQSQKPYRRWLSDQIRSDRDAVRRALAILTGLVPGSTYLARHWLCTVAANGITDEVRQLAILGIMDPSWTLSRIARVRSTRGNGLSRPATGCWS